MAKLRKKYHYHCARYIFATREHQKLINFCKIAIFSKPLGVRGTCMHEVNRVSVPLRGVQLTSIAAFTRGL